MSTLDTELEIKMTLFEKLNQIFGIVFDCETINISPEMTANDINGWDSLSHVNLIVAVENAFAIRFSQKQLLTLKNICSLQALIEQKLS